MLPAPRTMYDAVYTTNIPSAATMVAGYIDGVHANIDQVRKVHPRAQIVQIAVLATTNAGHVLDVENTDAIPTQAVGWIQRRRAAGMIPTVYANRSTWPQVQAACKAARVAQPLWWCADPDNQATPYPGAIAKQYKWAGPYDLSLVHSYWPGVDAPLTAAETVEWFRSHQVNLWGPNDGYVNPFSTDLGRPGEYYCSDAVTDTLLIAGIDIRDGCPGYFNVGELYRYMWGQPGTGHLGFHTVPLDQARDGDVTMLWFGGVWGHVFMHRAPNSGGYLHSIEGDTSSTKFPGSEKFAGVTTDRDRSLAQWRGLTHTFRPTGYRQPPAPPVDAFPLPKGHVYAVNDGTEYTHSGVRGKPDTTNIARIQRKVTADTRIPLKADGLYGRLTRAAVITYQHGHHLTADGLVGPHTWAALRP